MANAELASRGLSPEMQEMAREFLNNYVIADIDALELHRIPLTAESVTETVSGFKRLQNFSIVKKVLIRNAPHLAPKINDRWRSLAQLALSAADNPISCLSVAFSVLDAERDFVSAIDKAIQLLKSGGWDKGVALHVVSIGAYNSRLTPREAADLLKPYKS